MRGFWDQGLSAAEMRRCNWSGSPLTTIGFPWNQKGYEAGGSGAEKGNTKDLLTGSEYPYRRKTHIAVPFSLPPTRSHFFNVKPQAVIA
jgi:hypothetical protein